MRLTTDREYAIYKLQREDTDHATEQSYATAGRISYRGRNRRHHF